MNNLYSLSLKRKPFANETAIKQQAVLQQDIGIDEVQNIQIKLIQEIKQCPRLYRTKSDRASNACLKIVFQIVSPTILSIQILVNETKQQIHKAIKILHLKKNKKNLIAD